jgi:hypothetical protein
MRRGRQQTLPQTAYPIAQKTLIVTEMNPNAKKMDKLEAVMTKMMLNSMNGNQQQLDEQNRLINMNRVELAAKNAVSLQNVQTPVKPVLNTQTTHGQTSKIVSQTSVKTSATPFVPVVPNVIPAPYKLNREHHHHHHNHHNHHNHHHHHDDDDDDDDDDDHDDDHDDDDHERNERNERKWRFLRWKREFFNRLRLSKMNRKHIHQRYIRH